MAINPKGTQLKMFMSPREIVSQYRLGDSSQYGDRPPGTVENLYEDTSIRWKLDAARSSGLNKRIRDEGVKKPVDVVHDDQGPSGFLTNGHHRLLSQAQMDPDKLMPVLHHADAGSADYKNQYEDPTGDQPYRYKPS